MSALTDMDAARAAYGALPATVALKVDWADIGGGVRGAPEICALALAAKRELGPSFPPGTIFSAHHFSLHIITRNWSGRFWIDDPGCKFMVRFDQGKRVKPGVYEIHKPGTGIIKEDT